MPPHTEIIPIPLFHGSSSHYRELFTPGEAPAPWPHKDVALGLLKDVWMILSSRRHEIPAEVLGCYDWDVNFEEIPWHIKNIIEQTSGYNNWQHGDLYLTPSKVTGVNYACAGAKHGGELLTFCKKAVEILTALDSKAADNLIQSAESLDSLLRGTDQPPILIEFTNIKLADLSTEREKDDIQKLLSHMTSTDHTKRFLRQQANLRLARGCGIVNRIFEVHTNNSDNRHPLDPFCLKEIT